eukprot:SAG11_NODE_51190_length_111_cov_12.916667_1_plen_34_part_10
MQQFELYAAVTEGSEEEIVQRWTTAVVNGQGGID